MFPYAFAKIRQHQPAVRRLPETDRGAVRGVMLSSIPYQRTACALGRRGSST